MLCGGSQILPAYDPNPPSRESDIKRGLELLKVVSLTIKRLFVERNKVRWLKMPFSAWTASPVGNMTIKESIFIDVRR
jgi:hypothetical protein